MRETNVTETRSPDYTAMTGRKAEAHTPLVIETDHGSATIKHVEQLKIGLLIEKEYEPGGVTLMMTNLRSLKGQMIILNSEEARSIGQSILKLADEQAEIEAGGKGPMQ